MEKRSENQSVKFWLLGTEEAVGGRTVKKTFTLLLLACNMMMLAMLSLVPIETHLEADFVVCLPSDLYGILVTEKLYEIFEVQFEYLSWSSLTLTHL